MKRDGFDTRVFLKIYTKHLILPVCTGVLLAIGWAGYVFALDKIRITVDGVSSECKTLKTTVAGVLDERGIILKPGDVVQPGLKLPIQEGLHIEVIRSFPVTIKKAGQEFEFFTIGQTVADVLAQAGINYHTEDKINPGLEQIVQSGQEIEVIEVTSKILTTTVPLRAGTEYRRDKNLEKGSRYILQQGLDGLAERQVKVIYENGRESNRLTLAEKVIRAKLNTIIVVGIKPVVRVLETSRGSYRYTELKVMEASAYNPGPESCGKYAKYGLTYTGKKAGFGMVAVDPKVIPLGTQLYIEGYGRAEAADIGGAIKGNRIDLGFETYREAIMYGRKQVKVYILSE